MPAPSTRGVLSGKKSALFEALCKAGLAEYDETVGIAWRWQSIEGTMMKAPPSHEAIGLNPTASCAGGWPWRPALAHRDGEQTCMTSKELRPYSTE